MSKADPQPTDVDRWFIERGVPHLMPNYSASEDILTRMFRFVVLVIFVELFLTFSEDVSGWAQAGWFAIGLGVVGLSGAVVNLIRGRVWHRIPDDVGLLEVATFVLVPPMLRAVTTEHPSDFFQWVAINLGILAVGYFITSYGLFPMIPWALRHFWRQLGDVANLFAKSLPLLLLFSAFLFVNAEIWQVASQIPLPFFACVVAFLFSISALFMFLSLRSSLEDLNDFESWNEVDRLCAGTPVQGLELPSAPVAPSELNRRERFNLGLLVLTAQTIQVGLVAAMVAVFYVIFGLLTVGQETLLQWTTLDPDTFSPLATLEFLGSPIIVTKPLLVVSGFIAAFSGLQFSVSLVTDATYRDSFSADLRAELRQMLAVRCRLRSI